MKVPNLSPQFYNPPSRYGNKGPYWFTQQEGKVAIVFLYVILPFWSNIMRNHFVSTPLRVYCRPLYPWFHKKVAGKVSVLFIEDYREGPFSWVPVSFCFPCTLIFLFFILNFYLIVLILQPLGGADWLGIFGYSVLSKLPRVGTEYALPDFSKVCLWIQFTPITTHDSLYVRPFYLRPNSPIDNQVFTRIFNGAAFPR